MADKIMPFGTLEAQATTLLEQRRGVAIQRLVELLNECSAREIEDMHKEMSQRFRDTERSIALRELVTAAARFSPQTIRDFARAIDQAQHGSV